MAPYLFFLLILAGLLSCQNQQKNITKSKHHHEIAVDLIKKECDKPRALNHLLKAVKLNPKDFLIHYSLAVTYYSMGQYQQALTEFQKILEKKPDFTEVRVNLSRVYIDLNQVNASLNVLKRAEKDLTYPHKLKILSLKGLAYYKKRQYKKAEAFLKEVFSTPAGKNCFTHLTLGKVRLGLGQLKSSEELLKQALSLCKKDLSKKNLQICDKNLYQKRFIYEGYFTLGQLYIQKRDKNRARYYLNLFLKKVTQGPHVETAKKLLQKINAASDQQHKS